MDLNPNQLFEFFFFFLIIKSQTTFVNNPNYSPVVRSIVFIMWLLKSFVH